MAEIFGAVASGAGLASLAIQLVDSAQKLKALYNASKDAHATVAELCFELETMSLSLRQLDSHRSASISGDELLDRCYVTCIRMVKKIGDAVTKIERLIQRRRIVGRLYMAFKEPEIRELLEELERSKSSMSFAYMSYCHSWSLREAAKNVTLLTAQSNAISSQIMQLHDLENAVQAGNSMILDRLTVPTSARTPQDTLASTSQRRPFQVQQNRKSHSRRKFRIALPLSFVNCVWEFGLRGTGSGWEFQLHPVNIRPRDSFVFRVVESGRVSAVRALLESGSLSMQDRAETSDFIPDPCQSLLDIAASFGHVELCKFLLEQCSSLCEDATIYSALSCFIRLSPTKPSYDFRSARQTADELYYLFMDRYGLVIPASEKQHHNISFTENVESNMLLTESSLQRVLESQFGSTRSWTFEQKFPVAMMSIGWSADTFFKFLQPCDSATLATKTDDNASTVLHWTAKHFGYWTCARRDRDACPDDAMVESYAALIKKLIMMGADVHAVNARHETPLMTALHQFMTFVEWPDCAFAVKRWGDILVEAGLTLNHYILVENSLLQYLANKRRVWNGETYYALHPDKMQLLIVEDSILTAEIQFCRPVNIWERWVPPGAWHTESGLPDKSIHWPRENDGLFWRHGKTVKIFSEPYLIQATSEQDMLFCSSDDFEENWRAVFKGTQDDHGSVASMFLRDRSQHYANANINRDRASSAPPGTTQKVYNRLPSLWDSEVEVNLHPEHWIPKIYRCPVDLTTRWRPGTWAVDGSWSQRNPRHLKDFGARSVKERLKADDDWEVQLLREQGELDVVKRFGRRFCPELRDGIEQELETLKLLMEPL